MRCDARALLLYLYEGCKAQVARLRVALADQTPRGLGLNGLAGSLDFSERIRFDRPECGKPSSSAIWAGSAGSRVQEGGIAKC